MSKADVCAAILWVGVDPLRDLRRRRLRRRRLGPARGHAASGRSGPRPQIDRSIGPVWEANHVWLIFVLVVLWTAFPPAFSAIITTLYIPLALAALGIVLRGCGLRLPPRAAGPRGAARRSRVFGFSSVLTPFFMGTVVGRDRLGRGPRRRATAIRRRAGPASCRWSPARSSSPLTAYIAAVFLVRDSRRGRRRELRDYFARRALVAAVVAGAAAVVGVIALHADARYVYDGLTSWPGIALVILSGVCGLAALGAAGHAGAATACARPRWAPGRR